MNKVIMIIPSVMPEVDKENILIKFPSIRYHIAWTDNNVVITDISEKFAVLIAETLNFNYSLIELKGE